MRPGIVGNYFLKSNGSYICILSLAKQNLRQNLDIRQTFTK